LRRHSGAGELRDNGGKAGGGDGELERGDMRGKIIAPCLKKLGEKNKRDHTGGGNTKNSEISQTYGRKLTVRWKRISLGGGQG